MKTNGIQLVVACAIASVVVAACSTSGGPTETTVSNSQEVVPGPDGGYVTECNGWVDGGPYNYCTWNCHNAANCGVDAGNDGIVSCYGYDASSPYGHAVNWSTVPCADGGASCVGYCISEPQLQGAPACCWEQAGGGAINIGSGPGQTCANTICSNDGGQVAFDAGVTFDTRACIDIYGQGASCLACCTARAPMSWCNLPDGGVNATCVAQLTQYLATCNAQCNGEAGVGDATPTVDAPAPSPSDQDATLDDAPGPLPGDGADSGPGED